MTCTKWKNRVLALDAQSICAAYGHEKWLAPTEKFVYWLSTHSLSLQKMVSKHDFD